MAGETWPKPWNGRELRMRSVLTIFRRLMSVLAITPRSMFFKQEMELTLIGLQNSGKTTLVNVIAVPGVL